MVGWWFFMNGWLKFYGVWYNWGVMEVSYG